MRRNTNDSSEAERRKSTNKVIKHKCTHAGHANTGKVYIINDQNIGYKQSPIALWSRKVQPGDVDPISFRFYDVPLEMPIQIHNDGHIAHASIHKAINGAHPSLSGGGVSDVYDVVNVHFHWGAKAKKGSEHAINGKKYDLEMHIVHKNARFADIKDALEDPYGFVVLSVLFEKTQQLDKENPALNLVYDSLPRLQQYDSTDFLDGTISMLTFLGDLNTDQFFMYRGSFTTPPFTECVTWIIFSDIQPIRTDNLNKFLNLSDNEGQLITTSDRPLQSSFLRQVHYRNGQVKNE